MTPESRIRPFSGVAVSGDAIAVSWSRLALSPSVVPYEPMERPGKFENFRWVGDKRTQIVYDVDSMADPTPINELMEAGTYLCFGPDTLAEARNRGFRPFNGVGHD